MSTHSPDFVLHIIPCRLIATGFTLPWNRSITPNTLERLLLDYLIAIRRLVHRSQTTALRVRMLDPGFVNAVTHVAEGTRRALMGFSFLETLSHCDLCYVQVELCTMYLPSKLSLNDRSRIMDPVHTFSTLTHGIPNAHWLVEAVGPAGMPSSLP